MLSGHAVADGLPFYAILSLPILFAAGMSLLDTIDGCFMNFAYGWAFARPIRKIYYNITITGLSVVVAFAIGTIEFLGLLPSELNWGGRVWALLRDLQHQLGRFRHRRTLRRHLGGGPFHLALRPGIEARWGTRRPSRRVPPRTPNPGTGSQVPPGRRPSRRSPLVGSAPPGHTLVACGGR